MKSFLIALFSISILFSAHSQDYKSQAKDLFNKGIEEMDKGEIENAIKLFEQAQTLDPGNTSYSYEIAHCHYLTRDYKKTIQMMQLLIIRKDATDHFFHLLGSSYEHSNNYNEALKTYTEGLKRFPESGILNYGLGNYWMKKKDFKQALNYFETGIKVEPDFSENYYWASKVHSSLQDKLWGIMYAELFINMEGVTPQSKELSGIMFDVFQKGIIVEGNNVSIELADSDTSGKNFELEFEKYILQAAEEVKKPVTIQSLYQIRKAFLTKWISAGNNDHFPNILFSWHESLMLKGYLEPYHYWLLREGNPEEFESYVEKNQASYDEFVEWLSKNFLVPSRSNYFVSTEYALE